MKQKSKQSDAALSHEPVLLRGVRETDLVSWLWSTAP
jgi:hypothetical protein